MARTMAPIFNIPDGWRIVVLGLIWRLWQALSGILLYRLLPQIHRMIPGGLAPPLSAGWETRIWSNWDGLWYFSIAKVGYLGRPQATAFFPAYPILLKWLGGSLSAGLAISWLSFVVGLGVLFKLSEAHFGRQTAWYAVLAAATLPTAFFYGALYSESLFFAAATTSLYFVHRRHYLWAAVIIGFATAVSVYGSLLVLSLVIALWRDRSHPFKSRMALLLIAPWGIGLYMAFLLLHFGHPLMFMRVQYLWGRHRAWPWHTLSRALKVAWRGRATWSHAHMWMPTSHAAGLSINGWNLLFYGFAVLLLLSFGTRLPLEWLAYAAVSLMIPLFAPSRSEPLMSFPRLFLSNIPLYPALGLMLAHSRPIRWLYWTLALPVGLWMLARFVSFLWVA